VFLRTGQVLAEIAGEDSVDFFLRLAQKDPERREAALWSLGQMGRQPNEALRERVLKRLVTHFRGEGLRQEAGVALAEAWNVAIVAEWVIARLDGRELALSPVKHRAGMLSSTDSSQSLIQALRDADVADLQQVLGEVLDRAMVEIPAGEFLLGDKKRKSYVDAFRIDRYPVINAQYGRFVEATGHSPPGHWEGATYSAGKALHPAVCVSWDDAVAYAEWAGKRLPTEEEWEKAARGTDGREYPWGEWKEGRCNTGEAGIHDTTPVGHYSPRGDSPYGCADMAGNVWEWTASPWESGSSLRVVRGGSWNYGRDDARCAARDGSGPHFSRGNYGFRCVSPV
jgi:hypothetical protein